MRSSALVALLVALSSGAASADVEDLARFLRSVEEATAVTVPLRGDGTIEVAEPTATTDARLVVVVRPATDLYVETRDPLRKLLVLRGGDQAYRFRPGLSTAEAVGLDAAFLDSDFTREDLDPFRTADYKGWRIADEGSTEVTVTLFPKVGQYSQVVVTFDVEKKVPFKTLYYQETLNNLVKIRRDRDFALIGRKWMPTTMAMETFKQRTHTTLTLRWTQDAAFPPELFDPVFLPRPSPLNWPTDGTASASTPAAR